MQFKLTAYTFFVIIISVLFEMYSMQWQIGMIYLLYFIFGMLSLRVLNWNIICNELFLRFYIIYSIILLGSQYFFVDSQENGYFVHNDSVFSFYQTAAMQHGPKEWSNLIDGTVLKSFFSDYPLFAFWINLWKLIGWGIGVNEENMRLFLRLQNLLFAPGLLAIMATYFYEIGYPTKKTVSYCTVFGMFTYLFLTATVFTRDLHVAFFYTIAAYYCLSPARHRFIYIKFAIISLICFGLRPENGMFALIFPLYYYFRDSSFDTKMLMGIFAGLAILIVSGIFDTFLGVKEHYNQRNILLGGSGMYSFFNTLPQPFSTIFNVIYSFIMPFPFTQYIGDAHIRWLGLTSVAMPFINMIMLISIYYYLRHNHHSYKILWFFIVCVLFVAMNCSIEPNTRRAFAIIPSLYMLFITIKPHISIVKYRNMVSFIVLFLLVLNIPAIIYLAMKGKLLSW